MLMAPEHSQARFHRVAARVCLVVTVPLLPLAVAGCQSSPAIVVTPVEQPSSTGQDTVRQTDDKGRALPFENHFPNRWNTNNDGTPYEPCTSIDPVTLSEFGLDTASVRDVAVADFQTARGCRWTRPSSRVVLTQLVGDKPPFSELKALNSKAFTFMPDADIDGRAALIYSIGEFDCTSTVVSLESTVSTRVNDLGTTPIVRGDVNQPLPQICQLAIDFTRATIDKMPP